MPASLRPSSSPNFSEAGFTMDADFRAALADMIERQTNITGQMVEALGVIDDELSARARDIADLRDELHALANRVESLTRALGDGGHLHSAKVRAR